MSSVMVMNQKCHKLDDKSLEHFEMVIDPLFEGQLQTKLMWVLKDFTDELVDS